MNNRILDEAWAYDFGRLLEFAGGERKDVGRAVLYGSRPPPNDSLWKEAKSRGFEVTVFDRNVRNREKKIDTQIAVDIVNDAHERIKPHDEVTLVAGDGDFVPVAESLKKRAIPFYVVFWSHASRERREICKELTDLDPYLDFITRK